MSELPIRLFGNILPYLLKQVEIFSRIATISAPGIFKEMSEMDHLADRRYSWSFLLSGQYAEFPFLKDPAERSFVCRQIVLHTQLR